MLLAPARFMAFSPSPRRENRSCCDTRFALTGTADRSNHSMTIPCLSPQLSVLASAGEPTVDVWTMPRCWTMDCVDLIYKDYSTILNDLLKTLDRQAKGATYRRKL